MTISFYKPGDLNGLNYVKVHLGSNAILNKKNIDKYCFLWSKLAFSHPCENSHPSKVKTIDNNLMILALNVSFFQTDSSVVMSLVLKN